jgi:VanZ family protein
MKRRAASGDTGTRLGLALLGYMLAVTLIVTLLPFQFQWPRQWRVLTDAQVFDTVANVLLFMPLGFLCRLAFPAVPVLRVLLLGALLSTCIEGAQLFESARQTAIADVMANALGAWLGALAFGRASRSGRADGRLVGLLALELPLMALTYLLVPLLWVSSLAGDGAARSALTILPGLFGAMLLGGLQRNYFGPTNAAKPGRTAIFAALWFLAGAFPLLPRQPLYLVTGAAAVGGLAWVLGWRPVHASLSNRRFEVPLLAKAAPLYAIYLLMIVAMPLGGGFGDWSFRVGFPEFTSDQAEILRLLEAVAAFTLLGYMLAEFRGRSQMGFREAVPGLVGWSVALALATEALRGYHPVHGASASRGMLLAGAVLYGGWLYHLQRAHVVRLLAANRPNTRNAGR